jgi:hypothetical protein
MRPRINKGTLVGSTNRLRAIQAKRLVVEVIWNFRQGIISERTIDIRQILLQ